MAPALKSIVRAGRVQFLQAMAAISRFFEDESMPVPRRDDDLFFVEFPKSGITWLTFLVANVNILLSGDERDVNLFNINDFVPEIGTSRHLGPPLLRVPGYRCLRCHSSYTRRYKKVFYLVRDPRNVMPSYWTFVCSLGWWQGTLEELVRHPKFGIKAWSAHVSGWIDGVDATTKFTLVRYEDLVADPAGELNRLYQLQGYRVSDEILKLAIERSSVERMRQSEILYNAGHPALRNFEFVRPGQLGGPRQPLPDELRRLIEEEAGPLMQRLGYSSTNAAAAPELIPHAAVANERPS